MLSGSGERRWLGWIALVLGVALFIPFADFVALLAMLFWILVTGLVQARARRTTSTASPGRQSDPKPHPRAGAA
jgi:uncharacterized membrane protein